MSGKIMQALIDLAYALDGESPPHGNATEQEMVDKIRAIASRIRYDEGVATKDWVHPPEDF